MVRLMAREAVLVLLTGLIVRYLFPALLNIPASPALLGVGLMFSLTFVALYAMTVLGGSRAAAPVKGGLGALALPLIALPGLYWSASLPGVFLPVAAALARPLPGHTRSSSAFEALYAYAVPMLCVRWLLVPLVGNSPALATTGLYAGATYLTLRGLVRLAWPMAPEGNETAQPLIYRPVPDRLVGLIERITGRPVYPFALRSDGSRDDSAVTLRCSVGEVVELLVRVEQTLADAPFEAKRGPDIGEQAQIMIRPRVTKS